MSPHMMGSVRALLLLLALIWAGPSGAGSVTGRQVATFALLRQVLDDRHYLAADRRVDDPPRVLESYLEALDPHRDVLLRAEVERFRNSQTGAMTVAQELEQAFAVFDLYRRRLGGRLAYARGLLAADLHFDRDETYAVDRHDSPWAKDMQALDDLWRRRVGSDVLSLSLAGVSEAAVAQTLHTRYRQLWKRVDSMDGDEIFARYVNALLHSLDPHSGYFLPRAPSSRQPGGGAGFAGVGIQLGTEGDFVAIKRVFAGGAAQRSGALRPGDLILAVGQGASGDLVDVVGWTLEDTVGLIRGPVGTPVRLQVAAKGAGIPTPVTALRRGPVQLEELKVEHRVVASDGPDTGRRFGVIRVPRFSVDYAGYGRGGPYVAGTAREVERSIRELEQEGVEGIVVDLRGNQGGALLAAVATVGLFVASGPVAQVRHASGGSQVFRDSDPRTVYGGPLVVLVDRFSASASEIFAAAIQDSARGVIVGEDTWGKGTVQETFDLNEGGQAEDATFGQLVLTVAEYFRVTGEGTQLHGVSADIAMPASIAAGEYGERFECHAWPGARLQAVAHSSFGAPLPIGALRRNHERRLESHPALKATFAEVTSLSDQRAPGRVSLNRARRRLEIQDLRRPWLQLQDQILALAAREGRAPSDARMARLWDEEILGAAVAVLAGLSEGRGGGQGGAEGLAAACAEDPGLEPRAGEGAAANIPHGRGLLWRVERPGTEPSHVFGTIHLEDPRVVTLPDPVKTQLEASAAFVSEVSMHPAARQTYRQGMLLPEGVSLAERIGPALFAELARIGKAQYGLDRSRMEGLKPWAAFTLLSRPAALSGRTLDAVLLQSAESRHIPVYALDSGADVVSMLDGLSEDQQVEILRDTVCNFDKIATQSETLIELYLRGDVGGMARLNAEPHHDEALFRELMDRTLYRRNGAWAARLAPYLGSGRAFVAVGALHLPGRRGLLSLLEAQGYVVSRLW